METLAHGAPDAVVTDHDARRLVEQMLDQLGPLRRVLLLPPDFTRRHSGAGELTVLLYELLQPRAAVTILPALGTHAPMTDAERAAMFPGVPGDVFRIHRWRDDLVQLGEVPADLVRAVSAGRVDYPIRCEVNQLLVDGGFDRIISIGQLVPHEVAGIANHAKNVFVGVAGADTINRTHYLGAACGMERAMGRADTPVRRVLQHMSAGCAARLPLTYLLTVRGRAAGGELVTRGLFAGDDDICFHVGARLCQQVNLALLDEPLDKVVVYLDAEEFKSTWLGNKAIYRTRMAVADGGELLILAPGVQAFGEDAEIDRLIRRFGYRGTRATLDAVAAEPELADNLSAAAHLIHGSSEGRFRITYAPGKLSREAIKRVGFAYADLADALAHYPPDALRDGPNTLPSGERVFFVSNPALGLWALRDKFGEP